MEPNLLNDAELVAQTLAGNREAFGQLYDRYARMVRAVVAGVSGDWPTVEDMTQECFLRGYRNLSEAARTRTVWAVDCRHCAASWSGTTTELGADRHEFRARQLLK